jgi:translation initiation factor IF-2
MLGAKGGLMFNIFKWLKREVKLQQVGYVDHWFGNIKVAGIKLNKKSIRVGDTLYFKGHTTDFKDKVKAIQIKHKDVKLAAKGKAIGIKVKKRVRENDKVFKTVNAR